MRVIQKAAAGLLLACALGAPASALADDDATDAPALPQTWAVHGQISNIWQYHPEFRSPYQGANSLDHLEHTNETTDATLFLGVRLWKGAEFWLDPEINQGIAPSNTEGVAGYVNGDGSKVGRIHPYLRYQRAFIRQTFELGGESTKVDPDQNGLGATVHRKPGGGHRRQVQCHRHLRRQQIRSRRPD